MLRTQKAGQKPRIFIFGEKAVTSAPSLSRADFLRKAGYEVKMGHFVENAIEWLLELRQFDLVVYIAYGKASDWLIKRVALAGLVNIPVIRWWVGSDVWAVLKDEECAQQARRLNKVMSGNIAVAPHLVSELKTIGIKAETLPVLPPKLPSYSDVWSEDIAHRVLVYLPKSREDFYGAKVLDEVIPENPDVEFILLRNDGQRYSHLKNVVALEWIEDMEPMYLRVGCLLRCTEHDGFPRMALEALACGRYVIYSWPLDGCTLAKSAFEVNKSLREIVNKKCSNSQGLINIKNMYDENSAEVKFNRIFSEFTSGSNRRIFMSIKSLYKLKFKINLKEQINF